MDTSSQTSNQLEKSIEITTDTPAKQNINKGLKFKRFFSNAEHDPFSLIEWETRDVKIVAADSSVIFEQKNVECPSFWSESALTIVASKYFYGDAQLSQRERSVRQLILRIVEELVRFGATQGYFAAQQDANIFRDELIHILLHQQAAFNSPVWFNMGVQAQPQCSACFILSVDDNLESIVELQGTEARLFKFGSGSGTNLSRIRSAKEKLSGGGTPSGPVSFMRGFDAWANIIKSGGKTRRAAKMQILNIDHPDILEFIRCKLDEERFAWKLIDSGIAAQEAYAHASLQNANLSVRLSDKFMQAVKDDQTYWTQRINSGAACDELSARAVFREIAEAAHQCGDPGVQFDDSINSWHTCPNSGRINASNPCSEYMHLDNSACNLSSINLLKFLREDGSFDLESFRHTVHIMLCAQDMLINKAGYPTAKIENCAKRFRQLGLGYANLGALLMSCGMPYDSEQGRACAAGFTSLMTAQAYLSSSLLAKDLGPFDGYTENKNEMLAVIEKHAQASKNTNFIPKSLGETANAVWQEALHSGQRYGYRNSQVTVLAPTGTISFMMDCDTTGVEPDIALVKFKKLAGGGSLKIVNRSVERGLKALGYTPSQIDAIISYTEEHNTIEGAPALREKDLPVFDCALRPVNGKRHIHYMGHLQMMAATQPFISGAISKTVNLPKDASIEDVSDVYLRAWELGIKAVAIYRDGSKRYQPLSLKAEAKQEKSIDRPLRKRLPSERQAITHKFSLSGLDGYITAGLFEDGTPGEIFLVVAKEGSTLSGVMDAFATSISLALQYGVPLGSLIKKFTHTRFEPSGFSDNPNIPMVSSIIDYVFKWLALKFLSEKERQALGLNLGAGEAKPTKNGHPQHADPSATFVNLEDAPVCLQCGSGLMVRQGGCFVCLTCGTQGGCG